VSFNYKGLPSEEFAVQGLLCRIAGTGDPLTEYKKIEEGGVADHTVTFSFHLSLRIKDPQGAIKKLWRNTT
jgi:hypothetical protein